ncbi:hypothetical protein [Thermoanaerobacterium thermosaccharolyticum]|nr:hypothetical protein [Thermoanaerobacterium thermosaccharolyticum]
MAKKTFKMHYFYDGRMHPLTEIKKNKKRRGRSRYLLSFEVTVVKIMNPFQLVSYMSETGINGRIILHLSLQI